MSSFNPGAKAGYTRTGKSLKSVRRYYAMLNQQKAKTPEEDKLSKRIAAELKTQQDANDKRSKREVGQPLLEDTPTERSALPSGIVISPKETGPVFTTPPAAPKTMAPAETPLNKSVKSFKTVVGNTEGHNASESSFCIKFIYFLLGLVIGLVIGAVGHMLINRHVTKGSPALIIPASRAPYPPTVSPPIYPGA